MRCTGVAAGGFSVFRASAGRNPVNAIVISLNQMSRWLTLLPLCFLSLGCSSGHSTDEYETAVAALASGTPAEDTTSAITHLESAGVDAFDVLLAHLDDETLASIDHFAHAIVPIDEHGAVGPYEPTIGDACFDLLHAQIEGVWPKGYRDRHVLNRSSIREWLAIQKDKSLNELRIECATLSLEAAKQEHEKNPNEWTQSCVAFFADNLKTVQARN
jgi:hypothetical protein